MGGGGGWKMTLFLKSGICKLSLNLIISHFRKE